MHTFSFARPDSSDAAIALAELARYDEWQEGEPEDKDALLPGHISARSHAPAAARHTSVEKRFAGQSTETPSQFSAGSHTPLLARHMSVERASGGQSFAIPSHVSTRSHTPAAMRHT